MYDPLSQNSIQQGWQCPVCKKVYAPSTPMCFDCPQKESMWITNNTSGQAPDIPPVTATSKEG